MKNIIIVLLIIFIPCVIFAASISNSTGGSSGASTFTDLGGAIGDNASAQAALDLKTNVSTTFPSSDHATTGHTLSAVQSGATLTTMNLLYLGSGGKWLASSATYSTTNCMSKIVIALETKSDTQLMQVAEGGYGAYVRDDSWNWTSIGQPIYMSDTAATLTQTAPVTAGSIVRIMGVAMSATVMEFNPEVTCQTNN